MIKPFLKFQDDHSLAPSPELEDFLAQETACRTYSLAQLSQDLQSTLAVELKPEQYAKHHVNLKRLMVASFLLFTVCLMVIVGLIIIPTSDYTDQQQYKNVRDWGKISILLILVVLSHVGRAYSKKHMAKIQAYRRRHAELATPVLEAATRHYAATSGSSSTTNKYQPVFVYREAGFWQSCASVEVLTHVPIKGNEGGVPLAEDYHQMA